MLLLGALPKFTGVNGFYAAVGFMVLIEVLTLSIVMKRSLGVIAVSMIGVAVPSVAAIAMYSAFPTIQRLCGLIVSALLMVQLYRVTTGNIQLKMLKERGTAKLLFQKEVDESTLQLSQEADAATLQLAQEANAAKAKNKASEARAAAIQVFCRAAVSVVRKLLLFGIAFIALKDGSANVKAILGAKPHQPKVQKVQKVNTDAGATELRTAFGSAKLPALPLNKAKTFSTGSRWFK